jgi:hypothetical protein
MRPAAVKLFELRGDAEAVTRGQQLAGGKVGGPGSVFEHEFAFVHDGEKAADLL